MNPARRPTALLLTAVAVCNGCGGDGGAALLKSDDGAIRLVHRADVRDAAAARTEMEVALGRCPRIDVVFAHSDAMAHAAAQACANKGRTGIRFVGVDGIAAEGRKYVADGVLDATIERPTCGAEAIDLALLAANGVQVPAVLMLGTRLFTRANLAAGGAAVPAAGDIALAGLRRQHAEVLTTEPKTDMVFRIGMAERSGGDAWHAALREDLQKAAARYPQVKLECRSAADAEQQRAIVREFVAQGFLCILIAPEGSADLAQVCKEAMAAGIRVVAIGAPLADGERTCLVGGDDTAIGRAAGQHIRSLLPQGGDIVELQGLPTSKAAQERHDGFAAALGLRKP